MCESSNENVWDSHRVICSTPIIFDALLNTIISNDALCISIVVMLSCLLVG